MAGSISFEFGELRTLADDLGAAPVKIVPFVRQAVERTARNVKDSWKPEATGSGIARLYASSIDYEMVLDTDGVIGAEIGPNLGRAGGSFGLLEDAPGGVLSAPQHAGRKAAAKNVADFEKGLLKAAEDALNA